MTWSEAAEQALCFGWIDGVRRKVDEESYSNRFTPRKANSNWGAVNIAKVAELAKKGLMMPEGIAAFKKRTEDKSVIYAYENELKSFSEVFEKHFRANETAWEFFEKQASRYKIQLISRVMTAIREKTRESRPEKSFAASADEKRL